MSWQRRSHLPVGDALLNRSFLRQDDNIVLMSKRYKMIYAIGKIENAYVFKKLSKNDFQNRL
jgi:hypothetical protein